MRELQTTETELRYAECERKKVGVAKFTYDKAMASEAHTGPSRVFPIGYNTPAAIGSMAILYANAHN
jgi:hypothetical protein